MNNAADAEVTKYLADAFLDWIMHTDLKLNYAVSMKDTLVYLMEFE
jgi:hypothetical protein